MGILWLTFQKQLGMEKPSQVTNSMIFQRGGEKPPTCLVVWNMNFIFPYIMDVPVTCPIFISPWDHWLVVLSHPSEKSWSEFVTWDGFSIPNCSWKVIKFHGSKPPTRGLYQVISQHYPNLWGFEGSVHYVHLTISMYGIYANIWGILMGSMLPYIAAPWILWVCYYHSPSDHHIPKGPPEIHRPFSGLILDTTRHPTTQTGEAHLWELSALAIITTCTHTHIYIHIHTYIYIHSIYIYWYGRCIQNNKYLIIYVTIYIYMYNYMS